MKIISLRVQIPCGDDTKVVDVKQYLEDVIRSAGRKNFGDGTVDVTHDTAALFDAADVKQGAETVKRKARA